MWRYGVSSFKMLLFFSEIIQICIEDPDGSSSRKAAMVGDISFNSGKGGERRMGGGGKAF